MNRVTPIEEVRAFYEEIAESYSSMMDAEIDLPVYAEAFDELADRIASVEGPVVDSSCGSGHMLERLAERYFPERPLIGVDLSAEMVAISKKRLGEAATIVEGDMSKLSMISDDSCAAVISYFALHHVDAAGMDTCFREWHRVLTAGGQLLVATWEGEGPIDYGGQTDVLALRYRPDQVAESAEAAGFCVDKCKVSAIEEMEMDAVFMSATKNTYKQDNHA